jgi:predicted nucleic acid-binding Zn ribbon protein
MPGRLPEGGRRRGGQPVPVGSVLDRLLPGLHIEERVVAAAATDLWSEVVGPEVARRTHAVGVRDGELLVEVQGAVWMGHLAILRQGILDDVNERLPADARLRGIRLVPMRGKEGSRFEPTG